MWAAASSFHGLVAVGLLLSQPGDVGGVDLVPGGHVLFHAGCHAGLLAAREGGSGLGNTLVEAVLLELLSHHKLLVLAASKKVNWLGFRTSMRTRALAMLASARTCFITACLTALESILAILGIVTFVLAGWLTSGKCNLPGPSETDRAVPAKIDSPVI